jgi:lipoprotein NlpD
MVTRAANHGRSVLYLRAQAIRIALLFVGVLLVILLVSGCVAPTYWDHTPQEIHVVRSGETLSAIADRYGASARALARWNNLGDGSLIHPGQVIRLAPPSGSRASRPFAKPAPAAKRTIPSPPSDPPLGWAWPANGRVMAEFKGAEGAGTGLLIAGKAGQEVRAAANGRVVYAGGGLIGYGQLIILKHNDTFLSAYGYNASLSVKEGQAIRKGQRIASMGASSGNPAQLHFEIRRNGKPVNPRQYLPRH